MKDTKKAEEILGGIFAPEAPKSPYTKIETGASIKSASELNDKNFVKIAENLYAQKDDLEKIWEVAVLEGKPYIVSKETSLLYKSDDYGVKDSKKGIEISKSDRFIDEIELPDYADKVSIVAALQDKINSMSFLPASLVVDSIRKEAALLSRKFVIVSKLTTAAKDEKKK